MIKGSSSLITPLPIFGFSGLRPRTEPGRTASDNCRHRPSKPDRSKDLSIWRGSDTTVDGRSAASRLRFGKRFIQTRPPAPLETIPAVMRGAGAGNKPNRTVRARVVKELDLIESNHGSAAERARTRKDPKAT